MRHEKNIQTEYFQKILDGVKKYELRLADRDCHEWDVLLLRERDPITEIYTGRTIEKQITHILKTKDVQFREQKDVEKYWFQIISFK